MVNEDFEQQVRARLQARAAAAPTTTPPAGRIVRLARRRQQRSRAAFGVVAVATMGAGGALAVRGPERDRGDVAVTVGPAGAGSRGTAVPGNPWFSTPPFDWAGPSIGDVRKINLPGWRTVEYEAVILDWREYVSYEFERGAQKLHVSFHPLDRLEFETMNAKRYAPDGAALVPGSTVLPTPLAVRGAPAWRNHMGTGQEWLIWVEGGYVWEALGEPFASPAELATILAEIRHPDEATWHASIPEDTVPPDRRREEIKRLLTVVSAPPGFAEWIHRTTKRSSLDDLPAQVYSQVICGLAERWRHGPGTPERAAAEHALRSVSSWPGIEQQRFWAQDLREVAERVLGGDEEAARRIGCAGDTGW